MNVALQRNYPLNHWWVAAPLQELTRTPISRELLDQRVVLFRTQDNTIVALEDRCAHRQAPLSRGRVIGDQIACPYHGFRYDAQGACTHVPTQMRVPAALRVRSFPMCEHGPFAWIWMGEPAKADRTLLPEISWSSDPAYLLLQGYMEADCSYGAIQENLMDDAHFNFLHCPPHIDWVEQPALWSLPIDIQATDRSVTTTMKLLDVTLSPIEAIAMGHTPGKRIHRLGKCTVMPPNCYFAEWQFEDPTMPAGATRHELRGIHGMTPISSTRSHWWWAYIQNYGHKAARAFQAGWESILKQDKEILEAIELTRQQHATCEQLPEILVAADGALAKLRRIQQKVLEAERGVSS